MKYGYARVSTKGQDRYGNGLDVQERQLREAGAEVIYRESYTGTKFHRPKLDELMKSLVDGDTLIVTKLDRVARSTRDGLDIIDSLLVKNVEIIILNMGKFDNSPQGKLMRTIFFAFAEFERDMIVMRTSEGKEIKRETDPNWREGRKSQEVDEELYRQCVALVGSGELSVAAACRRLSVGRSYWYYRMKKASA